MCTSWPIGEDEAQNEILTAENAVSSVGITDRVKLGMNE